MNIRSQNLLVLSPLFLALGLLHGALMYSTERQELEWSLRQEASALSRSIAAFTSLGNDSTRALDRILTLGQARRIFLLSADGRLLLDRGKKRVSIPKNLSQTLWIGPLQNFGQEAVVLATAPCEKGLVGVEMNATFFREAFRTLLVKCLLTGGGISLLGILLALILTRLLSRPITALTSTVASAGKPQHSPILVQELGELSHSFDIMRSVLGNIQAKLKRSLIENELFRSQGDLARLYGETFFPSRETDTGPFRFSGRIIGSVQGDFFGVCPRRDGWAAVAGRIQEGGELERMVHASAALSLACESLLDVGPAEAFREVEALFPLENWQCLTWNESELFLYRKGAEPLKMSGDILFIHTLGAEAEGLLHIYLERFEELPFGELMDDLGSLLERDHSGCLAVIKRN